MAQQQAPQGILGALGLQKRDEAAGGQTAMPFGQRDNFKDLMGNLAMGFNSMRLNPDEGLSQRVQSQQQGRRDQKRKNDTIEFLRMQPNGDELVAIMEAAGPAAAIQAYQQSMQAPNPMDAVQLETAQFKLDQLRNPPAPSAASAIGKLQSDLASGLIDQGQYNIALANLTPKGMRIVADGQGGFTIDTNASGEGTGKTPNERQSSLALFGNLMEETMPAISILEQSSTFDPAGLGEGAASRAGWLGNYLRSPEGQRYEALQRQWAEGVLRIQTGAAATQDEIDRVMSTYFPQPGDTDTTVAQKSQQRDAFARSLGPASGGTITAPGGAADRPGIGVANPAPAGSGVSPEADTFMRGN